MRVLYEAMLENDIHVMHLFIIISQKKKSDRPNAVHTYLPSAVQVEPDVIELAHDVHDAVVTSQHVLFVKQHHRRRTDCRVDLEDPAAAT